MLFSSLLFLALQTARKDSLQRNLISDLTQYKMLCKSTTKYSHISHLGRKKRQKQMFQTTFPKKDLSFLLFLDSIFFSLKHMKNWLFICVLCQSPSWEQGVFLLFSICGGTIQDPEGKNVAKSRITTWDFRRAGFSLFRLCLEESHGKWPWKQEGSRRPGWLSRITCSCLKNGPSQWAGK